MSQDIRYIKQQLKTCEEVDSPYDIKIGDHVKYITLKDESEFFYEGGTYLRMGDNKITLKDGSKYIYVPLVFKKDNGYILYRTRLLLKMKKKKNVRERRKKNMRKSSRINSRLLKR